jgi:hypothetical protein
MMLKPILSILAIGGMAAWGQAQTDASDSAGKVDRAAAYYYFTVAHMYAEKAAASRNQADADKAIENFKAAVKADPSIPITADELSGIYKRRIVPPTLPPAPPPSSK